MVLTRIWNFIKRHRRKIAFLGVAAGGLYVTYRYAKHYLLQTETKEIARRMIERNRQQYFDSMVRNADTTTRAMLTQTCGELNILIDTDSLTNKLKLVDALPSRPPAQTGSSVAQSVPEIRIDSAAEEMKADGQTTTPPQRVDKLAIWKQLKVLSFTKALSSLYSVCYLAVCIRIQLSLLSGHLFLSATPPDLLEHLRSEQTVSTEACQNLQSKSKSFGYLSPAVKTKYLETLESAFTATMKQLTDCMERKCRETVDSISLKQPLTLRKLDSIIHEIRLNFERELPNLRPHLELASDASISSTSTEHPSEELSDSEQLNLLLTESEELLNSSEFTGVLKACSDGLFAHFLEYLANHFDCQYHEEKRHHETSSLLHHQGSGNYATQTGSQMCVYDISLPLAKLVPQLICVSEAIFTVDRANHFIDNLLHNDILNSFSYNIYETFCENQVANSAH